MKQSEAVVGADIASCERGLRERFGQIAVAATKVKDGLFLEEEWEQFFDPWLDGVAGGGKRLRVASLEGLV